MSDSISGLDPPPLAVATVCNTIEVKREREREQGETDIQTELKLDLEEETD